MKLSLRSLFLPGALLVALSAQARIWRVNNNPGIDADYAAAQAAHDAATTQAGDTLHLEASQGSYGNLSLAKRLVLIGPGYFLNQNPGLQADPRPAALNEVSLQAGAAGCQLMGLTINVLTITGASNTTVQRNHIGDLRLDLDNVSLGNVVILQNYVNRIFQYNASGLGSNIHIANNYIGNELSLPAMFSGTLINNVIDGPNGLNVFGFVVQNNIFAGTGAFAPNTNSYDHNMGPGFGTANGNVAYPGAADVFVASGTQDSRWQLKPAPNPARGSGANGVDMGMFGGPTPYRLSGVPAVPSITRLNVPASGGSGAPLNITISVQSNN